MTEDRPEEWEMPCGETVWGDGRDAGDHGVGCEHAQYRKKPVVVEAVQFDSTNGEAVAKWCGGRNRFEAKASDHTDVAEWINIPTLEGVMRANLGDWIIRGVQGEFYPCKPYIFAAIYEPAAQPESSMQEADRG